MDTQTVDLVKRSAQSSLVYAAIAGVALIIVNLLSKIPFFGFFFSCLYLFGILGAAFGIAYLVAPKLTGLPYGQSKATISLWIGVGVALPLAAALVVAGLLGSLFDIFTTYYTLLGKIFTVLGSIFVGLVGGILVGTALAWLGSYFSLDRNPHMQATDRPF